MENGHNANIRGGGLLFVATYEAKVPLITALSKQLKIPASHLDVDPLILEFLQSGDPKNPSIIYLSEYLLALRNDIARRGAIAVTTLSLGSFDPIEAIVCLDHEVGIVDGLLYGMIGKWRQKSRYRDEAFQTDISVDTQTISLSSFFDTYPLTIKGEIAHA